MLSKEPLPLIALSFHCNDSQSGDRFSVCLQNMLMAANHEQIVINSSPLHYALTRDKVLFWMCCLHENLRHPRTELIKLCNIAKPKQIVIRDKFIEHVTFDYVVIKPTNATTTLGIIVVHKTNLTAMLEAINDAYKSKNRQRLLERVYQLNHPCGFVDGQDKLNADKAYSPFVDFWSGIIGELQPYCHDYVLLQEYIPPTSGQTTRLAVVGCSRQTSPGRVNTPGRIVNGFDKKLCTAKAKVTHPTYVLLFLPVS